VKYTKKKQTIGKNHAQQACSPNQADKNKSGLEFTYDKNKD